MANHSIDADRVYPTGIGMGGSATWALGLARPERPSAAAGSGIRVLLAGREKGEFLKKLPVRADLGAKDPGVPLEESERMIDALKRAGATAARLTVYPEALHDSWAQTYDNPGLDDWLLAQKRRP